MKTKTLILWLLLSAALPSFAYDFQSGNLCYNITGAGTVEVTRDSINDYEGLTNVVIPGTVTHNGKTYSVTSIGDLALSGCLTLTSVTISDGIVSIGEWAFGECPNLISVTIPNSVTTIGGSAFSGAMITSLTLPNNLTTIGEAAFMFCLGLTSVDIPSSVTYIGEEAFTGCLNIMSLTVPTGVTNIGEDAFQLVSNVIYSGTATGAPWGARSMNGYVEGTFVYADATKTSLLACNRMAKGAITIPNSVTSIGNNAFYYCDSITSITIPNSVTSIGEWVFRECYSLTSITIPSSVTSIGERAFQDCSGLTSVTIPNSVTSIGKEAFFRCSSLTSITIPNSVISIGSAAFYFVPNIAYSGTATGAPWGARSINGYVEGYLVYSDATKKTLLACSSAATGAISIPYSVTSIGEEAFSECYSLTSVTIPNSVTSIGEYAFYDVPNIAYFGTATGAPWGARSINGYVEGYLVYSDATKKTLLACSSAAKGNITIPNSVTSIGEEAFYDCEELTSVTCYAIEPPQIYYNSFGYDIDSIPLYVPIGSVEKYKVAEYWRNYFKEILPISAMPADVDEPVIDPESTTVTITWPATDEAATYTIEISKDGALVCTLTFDANGVLKNMRFAAPARHAAQHTTQAETTGSGFRFVVEGLDYATTYSYTITAKDTEDKVVESYNGTFTTTAPTSTEDVHSTPSQPAVRKVFRNGQVLILRGGKTYTLTGDEL